jgi:hypothetical protein
MFYRLRQSLAYQHFRWRTNGIESTPFLKSDPSSPCEVHTMLGVNDITMYILAIKSLLSYIPALSVVVHSDGSLTHGELARLVRHVEGIRFVLHEEADERAADLLRNSPFLTHWRTTDAAYRRLVDIELWRQADKVIILDSDVLTSHEPREVIEWVRSGTRPFLLGQPSRQSLPAQDPGVQEHVQRQFVHKVPEISALLNRPPLFVQGTTAGFCGYFRELALDKVEAALRAALDLGLPMDQWGGDQCLIIYLLSIGGGERLPAERYLNFEPSVKRAATDASIIHFYGTHRFHGLVYPTLAAKTVRRLADRSA